MDLVPLVMPRVLAAVADRLAVVVLAKKAPESLLRVDSCSSSLYNRGRTDFTEMGSTEPIFF